MVRRVIVVDSSVWIAHFNHVASAAVAKLHAITDPNDILVADIVLLEVLRGARDERHAAKLEASLRTFQIVPVLGDTIAVAAARNYRILRSLAFTVSKIPDLLLATYCITERHQLLHNDRDFAAFEKHLGLRVH